jgi:hypothetical protein
MEQLSNVNSLSPDSASIEYGTRDYAGEGYLILINTASTATSTHLTLSGLSYKPSAVKDAFTDADAGTATATGVQITLKGNSTGVYRLVAPAGVQDAGSDGMVSDAGAGASDAQLDTSSDGKSGADGEATSVSSSSEDSSGCGCRLQGRRNRDATGWEIAVVAAVAVWCRQRLTVRDI